LLLIPTFLETNRNKDPQLINKETKNQYLNNINIIKEENESSQYNFKRIENYALKSASFSKEKTKITRRNHKYLLSLKQEAKTIDIKSIKYSEVAPKYYQ